ncbi:MAG: septum formation initiator family protein [Alicyclobacillaceae bacterium]|nr:septum formation initiator family protein [Alicyclobacillaceae bacterium]
MAHQSTTSPRLSGEPLQRGHGGWPQASARRARNLTRRFKWRYVFLALVCAWACYHYTHVQRPQLQALRTQEQQLEQRLRAATREQAKLRQQVEEFQNDQFIARYASEHYNLIGPGEVSFSVEH